VLADAIAGEPARAHPVALFGPATSALERRVYDDHPVPGMAYAGAGVLLGAGPVLVAARLARRSSAAQAAVTAAITWSVIASRSLAAAADQVGAALAADDLATARAGLPSLCGRPVRLPRGQHARRDGRSSLAALRAFRPGVSSPR
jgi:adenosylcobinamide-phosphate synthase